MSSAASRFSGKTNSELMAMMCENEGEEGAVRERHAEELTVDSSDEWREASPVEVRSMSICSTGELLRLCDTGTGQTEQTE